MAPYIPVPQGVQANVRFLLDNQQIENVLNFDIGPAAFEAACDAIYSTLNDVWWAGIRNYLSDAVFSVETYMVDISSADGLTVSKPAFTPGRGVSSEYSAPNSSAFCVTHRTAHRGRSFRGRNYISGIARTNLQNSSILATPAAAIVEAFNDMRTALAADAIYFTIVSRYENKLPRTTGVLTDVNQSLARDLVVDSQRRRLPGRGT